MMKASDFRVALIQLGISQKRFAELIGYRDETISRWATGKGEIPRVAELVIELLRYKASLNPPGEAA